MAGIPKPETVRFFPHTDLQVVALQESLESRGGVKIGNALVMPFPITSTAERGLDGSLAGCTADLPHRGLGPRPLYSRPAQRGDGVSIVPQPAQGDLLCGCNQVGGELNPPTGWGPLTGLTVVKGLIT